MSVVEDVEVTSAIISVTVYVERKAASHVVTVTFDVTGAL